MTTQATLTLTVLYDGDYCDKECPMYFTNWGAQQSQCHLFGEFLHRESYGKMRYKRHAACIKAAYDGGTEEKK